MKKKFISALLTVVMLVSVTACTPKVVDDPATQTPDTTTATVETSVTEEVKPVDPNCGKWVYLSLTPEEQSLYDQIYNAVNSFQKEVKFDKEYSKDTVLRIYRNVYFQEPELFWFHASNSVFDGAPDMMSSLVIEYKYPEDNVKTMKPLIDSALDSIEKTFPANATDADKVIAIHDFIAAKTEFSKDATFCQDAYGALAGDYAQCEGYAKGFAYACRYFGIDCVRITGDKYDGNSHAWNKVKIDGKWYNVDLTWDDPDGTEGNFVRHNFMFVPDAKINGITHILECDFEPPVADSEDLDYFKYTGKYATSKDEAMKMMQEVMIENAKVSQVACQVKCSNEEDYKAVIDEIFNQGGYKALIEKTNAESGGPAVTTISMSNDDAFYIVQVNLKF